MTRTVHAISLAVGLALVVVVALGALPVSALTFGLSPWLLAAVCVGVLVASLLAGVAVGARRGRQP